MGEPRHFDVLSYKYEFRGDQIFLELQSASEEKVLIEFSKDNTITKNVDSYAVAVSKHLEYFPHIRDMLTTEQPVYFKWVKDEKGDIDWSIGIEFEPLGIYDEDYEQEIVTETDNIQAKLIQFLNKNGFMPNIEEDRLIVPFNYGGQEFHINILYSDNWVESGALIVSAENLPSDIDRERLYARLLMDNLYIKEVNYGLTHEGDILIHAETAIEAFGFDNFETEFGSVIYGIQNYIENVEPEFPSLKDADHTSKWNLEPV